MNAKLITPLVALLLFTPALSWSGPNEGGVVIFHQANDIVYTDDSDFCGQSGLDRCSDADVTVEGNELTIFYMLAAFPEASSPRLTGVCYGIDYDPAELSIVDTGACGDFHLYKNWPEPGGGGCGTWNEAQTDHVIEIHWFAAYSVSGNSATLVFTDHPVQGGVVFGDDSVPSELDVPVDLGRLGFGGAEGYLPCPDPVPVEERSWGEVKASYRAGD